MMKIEVKKSNKAGMEDRLKAYAEKLGADKKTEETSVKENGLEGKNSGEYR